MSGYNRAVTGQCQSNRFIQAIHGISGKHAWAASASGAGMLLNLCHLFIAHTFISRFNHGINQIQMLSVPFPGFHRTAWNKHSRYIQPHSRHQHPRSNLVTVTDANHSICLMGIYHILHTIGNDIPWRQGIKHSVVPHSDTVVNGNRIELRSKTSPLFNLFLYKLAYFVQVYMPGDELCKGIDYSYNGLTHLFFLHTIRRPQCTGSRHATTLCAERAA